MFFFSLPLFRYRWRVHAAVRGRDRPASLSGGPAGCGRAQEDASSHQGVLAQTSCELTAEEQLPRRDEITQLISTFIPTGFEPDERDHRGMLGPRRRGTIVGRLRGGAHRPNRQDDQQHYLRQPRLHCDVSHQRGPTSQRVQHLNQVTPSSHLSS